MEKDVDLVSKYLEIYDKHYLKGNKDINEISYIVNVLNTYKDKLSTLNESFIEKMLDTEINNSSIKERFGIDELIIILDKNKLDFNNRYCFMIQNILTSLLYSKEEINNEELNQISYNYIQTRYGFEAYISESYEFRSFIKEIEKNCGYSFKNYLFDFLTFVGAYIYYNSLDPELLRDLSIIFMCHYDEVIDILKINGFGFYDNIDNDYMTILVNLILSKGFNSHVIKKELS